MEEARAYESQDQEKKEAIDIYNEAERSIYKGQQYLTEKKKELSREEKAEIKSAIRELQKIMKKVKPKNITEEDGRRIKEAKDALDQIIW